MTDDGRSRVVAVRLLRLSLPLLDLSGEQAAAARVCQALDALGEIPPGYELPSIGNDDP